MRPQPQRSATCNHHSSGGVCSAGLHFALFTGTGLSAFGATSGTNNSLYGPRQMQFAAKLFF